MNQKAKTVSVNHKQRIRLALGISMEKAEYKRQLRELHQEAHDLRARMAQIGKDISDCDRRLHVTLGGNERDLE